jgi:4'-phosphopantetheinyl transferase EntD
MPPEEAALVDRAVPSRRDEFSTGRHLARAALTGLGHPVAEIGMGSLRQPLWPENVTGSISHDGGYCIASVHLKGPHVSGLGLDLMNIPDRIGRMAELAPMFVADNSELSVARKMCPGLLPEMLIFSFKEAVLKAISDQLDRFIDLREIQLFWLEGPEVQFAGSSVPVTLLAEQVGPFLLTLAVRSGQ